MAFFVVLVLALLFVVIVHYWCIFGIGAYYVFGQAAFFGHAFIHYAGLVGGRRFGVLWLIVASTIVAGAEVHFEAAIYISGWGRWVLDRVPDKKEQQEQQHMYAHRPCEGFTVYRFLWCLLL